LHCFKENTMRLSTQSRFAVTAMVDVGLHQAHGPVSLSAVSERQQISLSYLEQFFSKLRQHGLVESTRGPGGGYTLAKPASDIHVADILLAIQTESKRKRAEPTAQQICTDALWNQLSDKIESHLQTISLQSLMNSQPSTAVAQPTKAAPKLHRGVYAQRPVTPVHTNAPNSVFALGAKLAGV
jgi:Rrf2 family iron-sulfur cluster assembly transcriptional regulator